ncbi:YlbF family regulator [Paenibacillus albicereus]|uniref:YlbF family regulator n=1 Tax=Paenibacillus albicereus TaxID=2726185 RepID=A0A6H2H3W9_9BACL|nr:YlbF family regulator [Paenibacillus albicereus]QJC54362.1 YlbF family regulator [Paenibacillus albicereus]
MQDLSLAEPAPLDMAPLVLRAYELGDSINQSALVADYLYWKDCVEQDPEALRLRREFAKAKELFDECQRFGRFHPDYHAAKDAIKKVENEMAEVESIRRYKQTEAELDALLYDVSLLIAESVSNTIKVPSNNPLPTGGCGSGGSCSCGSGGCG